LAGGETLALVSDAGTPGISDPGALLVRAAVEAGHRVSPIPGPSAVTTLLSASGLPADRFVFEGFLPHRAGERRRVLRMLAGEKRPVVVYETPHRIRAALQDIANVLGDRPLVLGRELTKIHESILHGNATDLLARLDDIPRGEVVLAINSASTWTADVARKKNKGGDSPVLATNRSAGHEFYLDNRIECGIVLLGSEVKSIREGKINLKESYARVRNGEVFLIGAHISPYGHARRDDIDPVRKRKLLLHAREIRKLERELEGTNLTLVPTRAYLKNGRVKIEIAIGRGKKLHDKRDTSKKREAQREIDRESGTQR